MTLRTIQLVFSISLIVWATGARADCTRSVLVHQRRDVATIQRLESAWTLAFLNGDTEFESCLLTPDFTEIMSNGNINHLRDELALAGKNKGKAMAAPNMPPITVQLHGDVAVAYGISSEKVIDGKPHRSYYADYYVWKDGAWQVYFAQQTSFAV
ncbi:MAG: nuclear transport factor 2 family protein [Terriglobales bacterium]